MKQLFFILLFTFFWSCQKKQENQVKIPKHLNVIISPIANSTVKGMIQLQNNHHKINVNGMITGLIPNKIYMLGIYQYGDISSIDGSSSGPLLSVQKNKKKIIIGDIGSLQSDYQGTINLRKDINTNASFFVLFLGRSFIIKINNLKLGQGVIGIENTILHRKQ